MNAIEFILQNEKMDYENTGYVSPNNYKFANQRFYKNYIPPFFVPSAINPAGYLRIQKLTINTNTGASTWSTHVDLNLANLNDKYFQGEILTGLNVLSAGTYYRIKTSNGYISKNIFFAIVDEVLDSYIEFKFVDFEGDEFVDDIGDNFGEKI